MNEELRAGYKRTEVGVIPEDWDAVPLSAIGQFKNGINKGAEAFGHGSPFVNLMDVFGVSSIKSGDGFGLVKTTEPEQKTYDLKRGDVIFIRSSVKPSGVGLTAVLEADLPKTVYSGFLIRFRDSDALDIGFKRHCFYAEKFRSKLIGASSVSANTNINQDNLKKLLLALPPTTTEQRAIAAALGDVDALLGGLDSLIAKKRDLKQAAMQQLLTGQTRLPGFSGEWEVKQLGDVAEIVMGQSPSSTNYNSKGDGLPLIQGNADITNRETIKRVFTTQITKRGMAGDILMSVRAPVGEVSRTAFDVCLGRGVCAIRFPNEFLYHYLIFIEPNWAKHSKGSTFDSVNSADVNAVEIRLPVDAAEQTAIAAVLSDMDAELAALEARRDKTRNLKQAMMQELLTGRTRLVEPASNVIPVDFSAKPAPPVTDQPPAAKAHNWAIHEAVVVAVLVKQFGSEQRPLGRKRYTKLAYLMHRHVERVALGYLKKAAGPYNPAVKYRGPEGIAQKNGYIRTLANGKFSGFVAAEKVAQAEGYFEKWYGPNVRAWLEQFHYKSTDELELLATVDMAAEDLRRAGRPVDVNAVKSVIHDNPEWEAKLEREIFSDANIARAIAQTGELFQ